LMLRLFRSFPKTDFSIDF
jgi:hypothetical protein